MRDLSKLDWDTKQNVQNCDTYALIIFATAFAMFLGGLLFRMIFTSFGTGLIIISACFALIGVACKNKAKTLYEEGIEKANLEAERNRIAADKAKAEREKKKEATKKARTAVPQREIKLSTEKIANKTISEMGELKASRPRNGQKKSKYSNFVVIDIETTGIKKTEKIIEIAAIRYENFRPVETFTTLLDPGKSIPYEASKVNHISDDMVKGKPTFKAIIPALAEFVGSSDIVGQNIIAFDLPFMYRYGFDFTSNTRKYYDTLDIAKSKLTKYDERKDERDPYYTYDVDDYKLSSLCEYYGIDNTQAHRALGDCYATAEVFIAMLNKEYNLI